MLDALVIGAGVIGLTTGIRLAEAGLRVRILTVEPPAETTSVLASAMVGPTFAPPGDRLRVWEETTVRELTSSPDVPGVHLCRGLLAARPADMVPPHATDVAGFELCQPNDLPDGFGTGFWITVPLVDMAPYLDHLLRRLRAAGGEIEHRAVASLAEAADEAPRVANCSGLAARHLVPDPEVVPVRGPKVVVENPGIETFFMEAPFGPAWAGFHPHGDRVVLGGTAIEGDEDVTPRPEEAAEIIRRCAEIEPRLQGARVLEHRVGLRPSRPSIRLEAEQVGSALCVHNYGHGGIGVTTAWGCAGDAAALLTA